MEWDEMRRDEMRARYMAAKLTRVFIHTCITHSHTRKRTHNSIFTNGLSVENLLIFNYDLISMKGNTSTYIYVCKRYSMLVFHRHDRNWYWHIPKNGEANKWINKRKNTGTHAHMHNLFSRYNPFSLRAGGMVNMSLSSRNVINVLWFFASDFLSWRRKKSESVHLWIYQIHNKYELRLYEFDVWFWWDFGQTNK